MLTIAARSTAAGTARSASVFEDLIERGGVIQQDPLDNRNRETAILDQIVVELAKAKVRAHFVVIFAEQIHDLPFAGHIPNLLRRLSGSAGRFSFRRFAIESAPLHK